MKELKLDVRHLEENCINCRCRTDLVVMMGFCPVVTIVGSDMQTPCVFHATCNTTNKMSSVVNSRLDNVKLILLQSNILEP